MPLLARLLPAPLVVDVRRGALAGLAGLLADRRIATEGRIAAAVGPGQHGEEVAACLEIEEAKVFRVPDGAVDTAVRLGKMLRSGSYEAIAGIGGGRTIDVTKFAANMAGIPMVSVATNLSHDGIASPVSSLEHEAGKGSYGVAPPVAVIVDLDSVRAAPARLVRAGIGDAVSNLNAIADWELAASRGEHVDGLAVTMARSAANAVLHQPGGTGSDEFLIMLAEALILSGMAMTVAGSSRPCSGGDHEILHAIDKLFPDAGVHGELAGVGALFCSYLRKDTGQAELVSACLDRHGLPRCPADLGLSLADFTKAVICAPATRPGRYTILEHLSLTDAEAGSHVEEYVRAFTG